MMDHIHNWVFIHTHTYNREIETMRWGRSKKYQFQISVKNNFFLLLLFNKIICVFFFSLTREQNSFKRFYFKTRRKNSVFFVFHSLKKEFILYLLLLGTWCVMTRWIFRVIYSVSSFVCYTTITIRKDDDVKFVIAYTLSHSHRNTPQLVNGLLQCRCIVHECSTSYIVQRAHKKKLRRIASCWLILTHVHP